jgi:hypothetical protein
MIARPEPLKRLRRALRRAPIVSLLGPRQCGKTTLARMLAGKKGGYYFDLEAHADLRKLQNPELVLGRLTGLVILDEIQVMPVLFNLLRVLADRRPGPARFLILGSASPTLIRSVSESLAGRVEFVELTGFSLSEAGKREEERLWLRGGFPRAFLPKSEADSLAWREGFIRTFLERDIPHLGMAIPAVAIRRFWTMLAHYHGQVWNASEIARSMALSGKTVLRYLDLLTGTFMIRQLQPWYENLKKRQVKAPKVYVRDTGLLHTLLGIHDTDALQGHPKMGASWEGFALEETMRILNPSQAYFWATHTGAELDLMIPAGGRRFGVEFKFCDAPTLTPSMRTAVADLDLAHLWVVYPGSDAYPMHDRVTALPLREIGKVRRHTGR